MPRLIVTLDGTVIRELPLTKDRTTLGRRPYNDLVIDNLAVSGEHAVVELGLDSVTLEDLDSTNGTYVNGQAIRRQVLRHNDVIEIGKHRLRFVDEAGAIAFEKTQLVPPAAPGVAPPMTATIPLGAAPVPAAQRAVIKVLSGPAAGREVALVKVVTTIGKPGVAVAAITRRPQGFVVAHVDGSRPPLLNGEAVGADPLGLKNGDRLELAGTEMEFIEA